MDIEHFHSGLISVIFGARSKRMHIASGFLFQILILDARILPVTKQNCCKTVENCETLKVSFINYIEGLFKTSSPLSCITIYLVLWLTVLHVRQLADHAYL